MLCPPSSTCPPYIWPYLGDGLHPEGCRSILEERSELTRVREENWIIPTRQLWIIRGMIHGVPIGAKDAVIGCADNVVLESRNGAVHGRVQIKDFLGANQLIPKENVGGVHSCEEQRRKQDLHLGVWRLVLLVVGRWKERKKENNGRKPGRYQSMTLTVIHSEAKPYAGPRGLGSPAPRLAL